MRRNPSYMSLFSSALALVLLLGGCAGGGGGGAGGPEGGSTPPGKLQPITIAQFGHLFLYLPLYVAIDKGFFKDEGLEVKLVSTGGDEKTFAAVSSGNAQFGVSDPTFAAIARERGQGGKVVAQVVNGVPFWGVTFRKDLKPIKKVEDLKGLRIATFTAPSTSYTVMKKVLQNQGKPVDAKIVQGAPTGSIVAMAKANQADIAMELEPSASIAVGQGATIVWSLQKQFGDFAITGLTVTDAYREKNGDTIQRVVNALSRAMQFIRNDFQGTLSIAHQEFPEVDEKILSAALKRMLDENTIPKSPVLSPTAWDRAIKLRQETGDIKGDGAYKDNVDMTFANQVRPHPEDQIHHDK
ncbi:MAG: ABC transporter substrate-binding protein [Candidatus Obscuribacterales bacterium]